MPTSAETPFNYGQKSTNAQIANKAKRTENDGECTSRKMTKEERKKYGLD